MVFAMEAIVSFYRWQLFSISFADARKINNGKCVVEYKTRWSTLECNLHTGGNLLSTLPSNSNIASRRNFSAPTTQFISTLRDMCSLRKQRILINYFKFDEHWERNSEIVYPNLRRTRSQKLMYSAPNNYIPKVENDMHLLIIIRKIFFKIPFWWDYFKLTLWVQKRDQFFQFSESPTVFAIFVRLEC